MDGIDFVLQFLGIRYRALVCAPSSIVTEQLKGAGKIVTNNSATQHTSEVHAGGWMGKEQSYE